MGVHLSPIWFCYISSSTLIDGKRRGGRDRDESNSRYQKKEPDWECKECGNKNYGWRTECNSNKCKGKRLGKPSYRININITK